MNNHMLNDGRRTENIFSLISTGLTNQEILDKICHFPSNYINSTYLNDPEMIQSFENIDSEEESDFRSQMIKTIDRLKAEAIVRSVPKNKVEKVLKRVSKHEGVQLESFKAELYRSGLITSDDITMIDNFTKEQFEKYRVFKDETAEQLEGRSLQLLIDTTQDKDII